MRNSIADFLPYDKNHLIISIKGRIRICHLIHFFCQQSQIAIKSYIYGDYNLFDAQVGENLCQIRAYQLALTADDHLNLVKNLALISIELKSLQVRTKALLEKYISLKDERPSHYTKEIDQSITLSLFLEENKLNLTISQDALFLIESYILSNYKLVGEHEISYGINHQRLCDDISINSKTFVRKFIHHLQRKISESSCNFIFKLLYELNASPPQIFLTTSLYAKDEDLRHLIACYEATKTILDHAYKKQKKVCINVTRISKNEKDNVILMLKPSDNSFAKLDTTLKNQDENNNLIVLFKGIVQYQNYISESKSQYIERFLNIGFEEIILSNIAHHPQFSGRSCNRKKYNPYSAIDLKELPASYNDYVVNAEKKFFRHKYLAAELGCCRENPSLFLLTHVRCSSIELLAKYTQKEPELYLT